MSNYYPPAGFCFQVRLAGDKPETASAFQEVSGLDTEPDLHALRDGGENRFTRRLPNASKHQNLTLKRGLMLAGSPLHDWCKGSLNNSLSTPIKPKDLTVSLLDQTSNRIRSWSIKLAWPVKWSVSEMNAQKSELAIESLELSYQRLERNHNST